MAALDINPVLDDGTSPTFVAAAATQSVDIGTGHDTFIVVKNGAGSGSAAVEIDSTFLTGYGDTYPAHIVSVDHATEVWIPIRKDYDPGDGTNAAVVAISPTTSVTVAAVRVS